MDGGKLPSDKDTLIFQRVMDHAVETPFLRKKFHKKTPYTLLARSLSTVVTCQDDDAILKSPTLQAAARHSKLHQPTAVVGLGHNCPIPDEAIDRTNREYDMDKLIKRRRIASPSQTPSSSYVHRTMPMDQSPTDHDIIDEEYEEYGQSGDYEHWVDPSLDQSQAVGITVDTWDAALIPSSNHNDENNRNLSPLRDAENSIELIRHRSSSVTDSSSVSSVIAPTTPPSERRKIPFRERSVSKMKEYQDLLGQKWVVDPRKSTVDSSIKIEGLVLPSRNRPCDEFFFSQESDPEAAMSVNTPVSNRSRRRNSNSILTSPTYRRNSAGHKNLLAAFNQAPPCKGMPSFKKGIMHYNKYLPIMPSSRRTSIMSSVSSSTGGAPAVTPSTPEGVPFISP
ncbi:hypothetical protein SeMB42_g01781 [Synchytrium endobioticum]|uniref:Uncharacterized protein n=1 Tax=Synchytrium endobioticum TaxID=286115 RepID=A0A507D8A5_9FUNG|nr:hypothetical protein SeLEV6574_g02519 [Synchytrium endobioticum]TPX51898.1 hypothetical protein SeMB42_g01781 [Synchytrium endobioticum]